MSQSIAQYKPVAQVQDSVSTADLSSPNWGLSVNYENIVSTKINETLSSLDPSSSNWGLGVNYEIAIRNVADSVG
jgi:hypothetical protein